MKKIVCPVDFSVASTNAAEYAAKLAQQLGATLTLLNVQKIYIGEGVSMFSGGERESVREAKVSAVKLEDYVRDINKIFNVSCSYEIIPSMFSFENAVAAESNEYDLAVIGTNGSDNMSQFYFGSHSFRFSKKAAIPVLIIPEDYSFREITKIVFASGYNAGDKLLIHQLKEFVETIKAQLQVLHISENNPSGSEEIYRYFVKLTSEKLGSYGLISFQRIYSENVAQAISDYMNKEQSAVLAVSYEEHGFLYRLFHKNLIKYLSSGSDFPLMVFHK